mgnify:CR=1 FL=1|jgi:hypothetical protein
MKDTLEITVGDGNHTPSDKRNCTPIQLELCCDSRREECPYYVKINIQTNKLSFYQGFCAYAFRKGISWEKVATSVGFLEENQDDPNPSSGVVD